MSDIAIHHQLGTLFVILLLKGMIELWKSQKFRRFAELIQCFLLNATVIEISNWLRDPESILRRSHSPERLLCSFVAFSPHSIEEELMIHHFAQPQTALSLQIPPLPTTMSP
jgi:hypothetical protein